MTGFVELLDRFKALASPEDALVPVMEPELLRFAAVWPRVPIARTGGDPAGESWDALWDCVVVDVDALALLADVSRPRAVQVFARLRALRLVYPDGGVPLLVRQLINKRVKEALTTDVR